MARYLNQIVYVSEDGEACAWQALADQPLSLEQLVYLRLAWEGDGSLGHDGKPISAEDVQRWIDVYNPFGPDNLDLEKLLKLSPDYDGAAIPEWVNARKEDAL